MSWSIPVKTEHMRSQADHEPSMQYAKDIHETVNRYGIKKNALEIGGAWGFSTLAILEAGVKNLVTVDPNQNAQAANEAKANGYTNHELLCIRSEEFWKNNTKNFDMIYVDGSHLYKDVYSDLYEAWKVLNKKGILMIDDWDHKKNNVASDSEVEYGVSLACFEFWRDHINEIVKANIHGRVLYFIKGEV